jgi:hypothetical protein
VASRYHYTRFWNMENRLIFDIYNEKHKHHLSFYTYNVYKKIISRPPRVDTNKILVSMADPVGYTNWQIGNFRSTFRKL